MMTLEDTIKTFECCTQERTDCGNCPQQGPGFGFACRKNMVESVDYWLKAQEPVPVAYDDDMTVCGECGCPLDKNYDKCPSCGRPVKWDD